MPRSLDDARRIVMELAPEDRLALVQDLYDSLRSDDERAIHDAWMEVAEERIDEIESGEVEAIPFEETIARARAAVANARRRSSQG